MVILVSCANDGIDTDLSSRLLDYRYLFAQHAKITEKHRRKNGDEQLWSG